MRDQRSVHTVARALDMLAGFEQDRQELAVREFAALLDVHKSTASRLAATLVSRGFLQRVEGSDTFRLGPEAARIGLLAVGGRRLVDAARPTLDALAGETGETVVLSVPAGSEALDVAQADSSYRVGASTWIGRRTPLHASSDGKALLAFGAAELPPGPLAALAPATVTRRAELARELDEIRVRGWATAAGDFEEGLNGVAAPIFGHDGACVGAVSVSGPGYRVPVERLDELGPQCVAAAEAIGARLAKAAA
jgi:DNA-binding IclR family transcriptional regulator